MYYRYMETKNYSKEIKTPANKKEGLENFVQMIINRLENDEPREALLTAVDLLQDLQSGIYSEVDAGNLVSSLHAELDVKHLKELAKTRDEAFIAGKAAMVIDISKRLGLVS
jgi:hypothetical protein